MDDRWDKHLLPETEFLSKKNGAVLIYYFIICLHVLHSEMLKGLSCIVLECFHTGSIHWEFWVPGMRDWDLTMSSKVKNNRYIKGVAEDTIIYPLVLRQQYLKLSLWIKLKIFFQPFNKVWCFSRRKTNLHVNQSRFLLGVESWMRSYPQQNYRMLRRESGVPIPNSHFNDRVPHISDVM